MIYNDAKIDDYEEIKPILNALNNHIRWKILQILKTEINNKDTEFDGVMIGDKILTKLKKEEDINISRQMLGQHLKILMNAKLVDRVKVMHKKENKRFAYPIFAYFINEDAFDNLLLFLASSFEDRIESFVDMYKITKESNMDNDLVITVFNGIDKGKQLAINKDEVAVIGRRLPEKNSDYGSSALVLSNYYKTVSSIKKPHLTVYNKNGTWYILDKNSIYGTSCSNVELERDKEFELPNKSLIKLSKGPGSAVLYCRHN